MFKATANPYDEVVAKATDENQTGENWDLYLSVWEKVNEEGEAGARNVVGALQKRLQHRNANVQVLTLSLSESLVNNCTITLHREIASKAFTSVLIRIVTDRNTHPTVKAKVLQLLKSWSKEFSSNTSLGLVEEAVDTLKAQGIDFDAIHDPNYVSPVRREEVSDDVLKREEEELQKAIAESEALAKKRAEYYGGMGGSGGYVPNIGSSSQAQAAYSSTSQNQSTTTTTPITTTTQQNTSSQQTPQKQNSLPKSAPSRVRALYDFEATEEGELSLRKGDVIKVIDSAYKDWWRGEGAGGRTGIFPVTYVEPIPDPTPESILREAEMEAMVLSQGGSIDKLLTMLRELDAKRDNLADMEELTELYQQSLSLRPKIVKLIEKYTQKKADLLDLNTRFTRSKNMYEQMMEESLSIHHPGVSADQYTQSRPEYQHQAQQQPYDPQAAYQAAYAAWAQGQNWQAQAQQIPGQPGGYAQTSPSMQQQPQQPYYNQYPVQGYPVQQQPYQYPQHNQQQSQKDQGQQQQQQQPQAQVQPQQHLQPQSQGQPQHRLQPQGQGLPQAQDPRVSYYQQQQQGQGQLQPAQ